ASSRRNGGHGRRPIWTPSSSAASCRSIQGNGFARLTDAYSIRLALPEDTAILPSIEKRAGALFKNCMAETGLTAAAFEPVQSSDDLDKAQRMHRLWVAVSPGGDRVGFVLVIDLGGAAHLEELDVLPEHGRRGLGSRLLETVCDWAREAGYPMVTL